MICKLKTTCPLLEFEDNKEIQAFSEDGQPITVFVETLYNQDHFDIQIITQLPVVAVSFYEYKVIPSSKGTFTIRVQVTSKDGVFSCSSPSLEATVTVPVLVRTSDGEVTTDSDKVTTDGLKKD